MNIKYGIVALDPKTNEILHFCGFEEKPTENDFEYLEEELTSDPDFNLIGVDFDLVYAADDIVEFYQVLFDENNQALNN